MPPIFSVSQSERGERKKKKREDLRRKKKKN